MADKHERFSIKWMLSVISLLVFVLGIRGVISSQPHPMDMLLVWTIAIISIFMCVADSGKRGNALPHVYRWMMFFTCPISIWIYFFVARGFKGLGLALLWTLIFMAIYTVTAMVGFLIIG